MASVEIFPAQEKIERSPLESKKFIAAMVWNIAWLFLIYTGIHAEVGEKALVSMIYVAGTVQSLYLGGQSAVDAFVRRAFAKPSLQNNNKDKE